MLKKLTCALAAGAIALSAPAAFGQSLAETMRLAYKNSNLLEQNRALLRAADETMAQAYASIRPTVRAGASATYFDQTDFDGDNLSADVELSAQMTLYAGGAVRLGEELAKENILATREALRGVEQQVLLNAAFAYFNLRKAGEVVDLQTNNLDLIARELEAARDRFEVGAGTRTDVALAEARLAAARAALAAAQGQLTQAREAYRTAVGQYPAALGAPGALPRPAGSLEAARAIARKSAPSIAQAQHSASVSALNVKIAETSYRPTVGAGASVSRDNDGVTTGALSLSVGQTIYQGGRLDSLYRQAVARDEANRAALLQAVLGVEQGVGNAWSQLAVANASLTATEEQTRAARLAFEGLREEASLGARTTLDVLDAEQSLLDAETSRAAAVNDRYIAAYALMSEMGVLTAKDLNLGVAIYDPAAYYESVRKAPPRSDRGLKLDNLLKAIGKK